MKTRVVLSEAQRRAIALGAFVRVGADAESVLVGRDSGVWRAYANVCRHRALPLDLGVRSPMSEDGQHLLCSQHGALYRTTDGVCVAGPCVGESLTAVAAQGDDDELWLGVDGEEQRFPQVAVYVLPEDADEASALLFELGASGIEERDATTLAGGGPGGHVTLLASFEDDDDARMAAGRLPGAWSPRAFQLVGDSWRDEWKKHFEPFHLAGGIVVRPPWRPYAARANETVLVLEPGRAFGTGLHETTRLVAEALADHAERLRGSRVLDVGCGSGILSLVALALGASAVRAVDIDPDAVLVTRENAARNERSGRLVAELVGAPASTPTETYTAVVANIEAAPLVELAPYLIPSVAPGGLLILSGILAPDVAPDQLPRVRAAYRPLEEGELRRNGEWVALVMASPRAARAPFSRE